MKDSHKKDDPMKQKKASRSIILDFLKENSQDNRLYSNLNLVHFDNQIDRAYYAGGLFMKSSCEEKFIGFCNLEVSGLSQEQSVGRPTKESRDVALHAFHWYLTNGENKLKMGEADKFICERFNIKSERQAIGIRKKVERTYKKNFWIMSPSKCNQYYLVAVFTSIEDISYLMGKLSCRGDFWLWKAEETDATHIQGKTVSLYFSNISEETKSLIERLTRGVLKNH